MRGNIWNLEASDYCKKLSQVRAATGNYLSCAIPAEAFGVDNITTTIKTRMRNSDWKEYDDQERIWPTSWYSLFVQSSDKRSNLTWRECFQKLAFGVNYYSSGDEVLAQPQDEITHPWDAVMKSGLNAWVTQEKYKGGDGVMAMLFRSNHGGWGVDPYWEIANVNQSKAGTYSYHWRFSREVQDLPYPNGVPSSMLPAHPYFLRFQASEDGIYYPGYNGARLLAPIGDPDAQDEARKTVTVAKLLGEAIPALSYATGSGKVALYDTFGLQNNIDMNPKEIGTSQTDTLYNGWPLSRTGSVWYHSDFQDLAYIYTYKLYNNFLEQGVLK